MYERIGIPKGVSPLVVPKEGGFSREENCVRRTGELDMKDITSLPFSGILLHGRIPEDANANILMYDRLVIIGVLW